jgi:CheY-like chemotaxis protein
MDIINTKQDNTHKRILVCDDVPENCFLLQTILEMEGYDVDTVHHGAAALATIENNQPDLLLLDLMMPGMDGYEVARRIQENPLVQSLPILLITAHEEALVNETCDIQVEGVIQKPIDPDAFLATVQAALQEKPELEHRYSHPKNPVS